MVNKGVLYGIGAYLIWGFFPLYLKALQAVTAIQIMFHRVVWSFLLFAALILIRKEWGKLKAAVSAAKTLCVYVFAAGLLSTNWLLYVWGVNAGHVVETSLGYFITPLVSVALGVVFLRERLRPMQWVPIGLVAVGVLYLTVQYGALPWIALALAGVVTSVPLLMFATAARSIPLSMMGLLQYIAPTCQFLLGVLVFGEPFNLRTPQPQLGGRAGG